MSHLQYRIASTLGPQYMIPQSFAGNLAAARKFYKTQQKVLKGLPGVDTMRIEQRASRGEWAACEI